MVANQALEFATKKHQGQYRKFNGAPYISHPHQVATYVEQFKTSKHIELLKACAYLHDTVEDTDTTYDELVELFGPQVAGIVLELTTDCDLKAVLGKTAYLQLKMKNMSSWALVIILCDRLDNISDLLNCPPAFRDRYGKETIDIIAFLLENRTLSNTHLVIIRQILENLSLLEIFSHDTISAMTYKLVKHHS